MGSRFCGSKRGARMIGEGGLAEEVAFGGADDFGYGGVDAVVAAVLEQDRGDSVELAHDEAGRGGEFVGDGDGGGAKFAALGVFEAAIVEHGVDSCDADGDVDGAFAPGAAEGVGDDDSNVYAQCFLQASSQVAGGGVGVEGEKDNHVAAGGVGGVDAGVGATEAVSGFGDDDAVVHADDSPAFAEDDFGVAGVFFVEGGDFYCEGRGSHVVEVDEAAFGFGDDFLGDDEDVAVFHIKSVGSEGMGNQAAEVVARVDFGDALNADDANFRNHDVW